MSDANVQFRQNLNAQLEPWFGEYGGRFVPETLVPALDELTEAWAKFSQDPTFLGELETLLTTYAGRPTPLYFARNLSQQLGRKIYFKREDLLHTGAHKINNALGQCLLAKYMGKPRVIAETGAGQHGVATATAAALLGLECTVFMGEEDMRRQQPNVQRMGLLGTKVEPVTSGRRTLKEACSQAIREWVERVDDTHYVLGTAAGPTPFPAIVRELHRVIGDEARRQILAVEGRLPDRVVACIGGGSNAIGIFSGFIDDQQVELIGVEAGGYGIESGKHGAVLSAEAPVGVLHGSKSPVMQDEDGQIVEAHSISAGLDYPSVGAQHAYLRDLGRARYFNVTDDQALQAFQDMAKSEGIIPALESSHAIAFVMTAPADGIDLEVVCLSGRGDKDLQHALAEIAERDQAVSDHATNEVAG